MTEPLIALRRVAKAYGGLRPFRMEDLAVFTGDVAVIRRLDEPAASVLVDLVTGTTLPDEGEVLVGGVSTATLGSQDAWLAFLDQFGIVNQRVVLLDDLTVLQNLAVPLTLDLDPLPLDAQQRATSLGLRVGLPSRALGDRLANCPPLTRFRVRLGRALAHAPRALLVEHPTLGLPPSDITAAADALRRAAGGPGIAVLVLTNDAGFGSAVATRQLDWSAATGRVSERRGWLNRMGGG